MEEKVVKPRWQTALNALARASRRRQQRQRKYEFSLNVPAGDDGTSYLEAIYRASDDPAFQYEAGLEEKILLDGIDALTRKQRMVVILHYFNELSFTEIGGMMGISRQSARRLCIRAEATLKKNITNIL